MILRLSTKIVSGTLIALVVANGLFFNPKEVAAQSSFSLQGLPSVLINCTGASGSIGKILAQITGSTMSVTSSVPIKNNDDNYRQECSKAIGRYIAKQMMDKITQDTINWINTGFKGEPAYIKNPESMFKSIADKEMYAFTSLIGFDRTNFPFGVQTARALIDSYTRTFEQNAQFSLNQYVATGDANTFYTDFRSGGWSAWNAMVLFPQNNPVGFNLISTNYIAQKTYDPTYKNEIQKIQQEVQMTGGFLNQKKCVLSKAGAGYEYNGEETPLSEGEFEVIAAQLKAEYTQQQDLNGDGQVASMGAVNEALSHICDRWEVVTPGKAISDQLTNALGTPLKSIEMADDLNKSLAAIFDALLNQLYKKGLSELTKLTDTSALTQFGGVGSNNSFSELSEQLLDQDNWSTYGQEIDLYEILVSGEDGVPGNADTLIDTQQAWIDMMNTVQNSLSGLLRELKKLDYWLPGPTPLWRSNASEPIEAAVTRLQDPMADLAAYAINILDPTGITQLVQQAGQANIIEGITYIFNSYYATVSRTYDPTYILDSSFMSQYRDDLDILRGNTLPEINRIPAYEETRTENAEDLELAISAKNRLLFLKEKIIPLYQQLAGATDPNEIAAIEDEIAKYVKIFKQLAPGLKDDTAISELSTLPQLYSDTSEFIVDLTFEVKKETWLWPISRRPYLGAGPDLWPGDPELNCWNPYRGPKTSEIETSSTPNVYSGFPVISGPAGQSNNPAGAMFAGYTPDEYVAEILEHDIEAYAPNPVPSVIQFQGLPSEMVAQASNPGPRRNLNEYGVQGCSLLPLGYTEHGHDFGPLPDFDPDKMEGEGTGAINLPAGMGGDYQGQGYFLFFGIKGAGSVSANHQGYSYFEDKAGIY